MSLNNIYRIIDANLNRASEALRVIEDWARFTKNNAFISSKLKSIRHDLNTHFLSLNNLVQNRESVNDVGKDIANNSQKKSTKDVIRANCKRAEEALRVLAEYGQVLNIETKRLEENRYEIYNIEKELLKNEKLLRLNNACLYLVTNRKTSFGYLPDKDFLSIIEKAIEGGVNIIQLREKEEKENKIIELAKEIKKLIVNTEILFIINDRLDIALACDSDGVHLGQDDMPIEQARKITPDGFIIGLSTHNKEQGQIAFHGPLKPDYIGVGPVFPTPTKPDYKVAGLEYVNWVNNNIKDLPWFAIGGIDNTNINKVVDAGAKRVSAVRAIMNAKDPLYATKQLKEALKLTHATVR